MNVRAFFQAARVEDASSPYDNTYVRRKTSIINRNKKYQLKQGIVTVNVVPSPSLLLTAI